MIYILKDRIIRIEWTILKGTSHVREDFRRANVKVFLIGNTEKYYLEATAEDGILKFDIPQGLEEGTYGIEAIWVKNEGHLGMGNRSISRSKKERLFSITEFEEEATNLGDGEVVLKFTSSTATYGYDGLSSYELAVLRGEWTGTEGEWLKHQRYVSVLDGRGDSETDTMSQKSITDELEAHDEAIEANKKAIEENKKEFDDYTDETDDRLDDVEERLDYIPKESFLSSDPAAGFNTSDVIEEDCVADRAISDRFGRRIDEEYVTRESVKNYTQEVVDGSKLEIMPGSVVPESLSPAVKQMIEAGSGKPGSITNLPDEEDITVTDANTLQFKDKEYNPYNYSGMGRVYLRKHIVNGTNVLAQHMINKPNTIYIIQYDYCLADHTIEIPENCVLQFEGGSFRNGELLLNDTYIQNAYVSFKSSLIVSGVIKNEVIYTSWYEMPEEDCYQQFKRIVNLSNNSNSNIYFKKDRYVLKNDGTSATIKKSIDFNYSTLVLETNGMSEFDIYISNSKTEKVNYIYYSEIEKAIKENNKKADVFKNFKNSCLLIESNDIEIERTNGGINYRTEYIYIDINGYVYNDFYGEDINITEILKLDCSSISCVENLNIEIIDTYTEEASDYRLVGFKLFYNSNLILKNILLKDPNINNYKMIFFSGLIGYNIKLENCLLSNTKDNNDGTDSAYTIMMNQIVDLIFDNVKVSNLIGNSWGCTGCNFVTNWNIFNSNLNRVDVHHRLNNLTVQNSIIGNKGITITGYGKIYVNNTKFVDAVIISCRGDFGGYFDGDIVLKDIEIDSNRREQFIFYPTFTRYNFKVTDPLISKRIRHLGGKNITVDNIIFTKCSKDIYMFREYTSGSYEREKAIYPKILVKNVDISTFRESSTGNSILINYNYKDSEIYDKEYPRVITFDNCKFKPWRQYANYSMYNNGSTYDEYLSNAENTLKTYIYYNNCRGVSLVEFAVNLNVEITNSEITGSATNRNLDSKNRTTTGCYNIYNSVINPKDQDLSFSDSFKFPNSKTATYNFYNCVFECEKDVDINFIDRYYDTNNIHKNFQNTATANMFGCCFGKNFCDLKSLVPCYPVYCNNNYIENQYVIIYNNTEDGSKEYNIIEALRKRINRIYIHNPGKNGSIYLIFDIDEVKKYTGLTMEININSNEGNIYFVDKNKELLTSFGLINPLKGEIANKTISFNIPTSNIITFFGWNNLRTGSATIEKSMYNDGTIIYNTGSKKMNLIVDNKAIGLDGLSLKKFGASSTRPTENIEAGFQYYDNTLNKPIWWTGTQWVDATGVEV